MRAYSEKEDRLMKRIKLISVILTLVMATSVLCACSSGKSGSGKEKENEAETEAKKTTAEEVQANPVMNEATNVLVAYKNGSTVFSISPEFKLEENSWLGICPAGKEYKTEVEADEVDIFWVGPDAYADRKANDPYTFVIDNNDINNTEDGEYVMVLCDNDDEGKLILQFPVTIKGSEITPDFSKIKINK